MTLTVLALLLITAGALPPLALNRRSTRLAASSSLALGCLLGLLAAGQCLMSAASGSMSTAWVLLGSRLCFGIDALSAFFMLPLCLIGLAASVYAPAYLKDNPQVATRLEAELREKFQPTEVKPDEAEEDAEV